MSNQDMPDLWRLPRRLRGADDAYSAWSNAQQRCTDALRAWEAARPDDRAAAYRVYVAALDGEEAVAAGLARLHASTAA